MCALRLVLMNRDALRSAKSLELWIWKLNVFHTKSFSLTECPSNVFTDFSTPTLQTWIALSGEHEANVFVFCQSISNVGAIKQALKYTLSCKNIEWPFTYVFAKIRTKCLIKTTLSNICPTASNEIQIFQKKTYEAKFTNTWVVLQYNSRSWDGKDQIFISSSQQVNNFFYKGVPEKMQ